MKNTEICRNKGGGGGGTPSIYLVVSVQGVQCPSVFKMVYVNMTIERDDGRKFKLEAELFDEM